MHRYDKHFISFFSLTFFISRPKIGTNEFMFLSLDTMNVVICLYLVGSIPSIRDTYLYHLAYQFHDPILYLSLFIACLMSISRMILLLFPSAQPLLRIRYLLVGIFLFILIRIFVLNDTVLGPNHAVAYFYF